MTVELSAERCLEVTEYLTRQAARYGISDRVELRQDLSRPAGGRYDILGVSGRRLQWAIVLDLEAHRRDLTRVCLTITRYRRGRGALDELPPAVSFAALLHEALTSTAREDHAAHVEPRAEASRAPVDLDARRVAVSAAGSGDSRRARTASRSPTGGATAGATSGGARSNVIPLRPYGTLHAISG
jgi:hypothetical protein